MKKRILFLIALIIGINTLKAQDLVIISTGDSINCNITKMDAINVYFTFIQENDIRNTMMPFSMVKAYQLNYYPGTVIPVTEKVINKDFPRWKLGVNGGVGRHTDHIALEVPSDMVEYAENLRSGYHLSADAYYYMSEFIGIGARYVSFNATADKMSDSNLGNFTLGVRFYGPAISGRLMNESKKNAFYFNMALGRVDYKMLGPVIRLNGGTFSSMFDVGYDITIYKRLAIGMQLSYLAGYISSFTGYSAYLDGPIELGGYRESLNRLDLSVGLKFNL